MLCVWAHLSLFSWIWESIWMLVGYFCFAPFLPFIRHSHEIHADNGFILKKTTCDVCECVFFGEEHKCSFFYDKRWNIYVCYYHNFGQFILYGVSFWVSNTILSVIVHSLEISISIDVNYYSSNLPLIKT